ncbi:MAG: LPXTG cell wall anchor domain-containing protein [Solirubrobacterales bacterium]|nr:LPXTG cell wall anchor domain-containing protein [Solirubrobacterales bacterium]
MPPLRRSIVLLCALLTLGAATPVAAPVLAQSGAGDEQYQDPFEDDGGTSGSGTSTTQTNPQDLEQLSPTPQQTQTQPSQQQPAQTQGTTTTPAATTPSAAGSQLPNTGADARALALIGLVMLLFGVGLRLRTQPERF